METPEEDEDIFFALEERDTEALYKFAESEREAGNETFANYLISKAKEFDDGDWAYDRQKDNQL